MYELKVYRVNFLMGFLWPFLAVCRNLITVVLLSMTTLWSAMMASLSQDHLNHVLLCFFILTYFVQFWFMHSTSVSRFTLLVSSHTQAYWTHCKLGCLGSVLDWFWLTNIFGSIFQVKVVLLFQCIQVSKTRKWTVIYRILVDCSIYVELFVRDYSEFGQMILHKGFLP
jgi:hypothetical protein